MFTKVVEKLAFAAVLAVFSYPCQPKII